MTNLDKVKDTIPRNVQQNPLKDHNTLHTHDLVNLKYLHIFSELRYEVTYEAAKFSNTLPRR